MAARRGTDLHAFAHEAIRLGIKLPRATRTLNLYVNDAIGFKMVTEQPLYYSDNCFGHVDSIAFRRNTLRIHDLKTGISSTKETQLEVYAALFCLEYQIDPFEIEIILRIYQSDEVREYIPDPADILYIMNKIVDFDNQVEQFKKEDLW